MTARKSPVTIATLARHAGVSRVAVYAALHPEKKTTALISDATRAKILAAVNELGYVPNDMARTLVSGRSRTVAMLIQGETRLSRNLVAACSKLFLANGYLLIAECSNYDAGREREILEQFLIKRPDCAVIGWQSADENGDLAAKFAACRIPVISLLHDPVRHPHPLTVNFNEDRVMVLVAEHLRRMDCRRALYAAYRDRGDSGGIRWKHLRAAVAAKWPALSLSGPAELRDRAACEELARRLAAEFKVDPARAPEVIVCYNDALAFALAVELRLAGFRIPQDIGLIGIDGYGDDFDPVRLTSVRLPVEAMAEGIFEVFASGREEARHVSIEPELHTRDTTRPVTTA